MRTILVAALVLAAACKGKAGDAPRDSAAAGAGDTAMFGAADTAAVGAGDTAAARAGDTAAVLAADTVKPTAPAPTRTPTPTPTPAPAAPAATAGTGMRDAYHTAPRDTISRVAYDGWKQYELNCARCHGEYAVGTSFAPSLAVSLKPNGTVPTQEMFVTIVCQGRKEKGMPSWCELGLEMSKIQGMYAYLKGRADGKIGVGRPAVRES